MGDSLLTAEAHLVVEDRSKVSDNFPHREFMDKDKGQILRTMTGS